MGLYWNNGKENGNYYLGFRTARQQGVLSTAMAACSVRQSLLGMTRSSCFESAVRLSSTKAHGLRSASVWLVPLTATKEYQRRQAQRVGAVGTDGAMSDGAKRLRSTGHTV